MDINTNSTWFKVAKAVALPIPTAVEAIYDAIVDDKPAPPPPPPPPPPELKGQLPDANATPADARAGANGVFMKGATGKDITSPGAKAEIADLEGRIPGYLAAAEKAEKAGDKKKAQGFRDDVAKFKARAEELRKDAEGTDTAAVKQTFANRKLEKDALEKLTPAQQEQYKKLEAKFEHDPQGHLALQLLLIEGKLTHAAGNQNGKDLLAELGTLATAKLADPLKNDQMLSEVVREIANPASIKQKDKNTCSVASLQIMMATERPAEYVRILTGLAGEGAGGPVKLAGKGENGQDITVKRLEGVEMDDSSGRTSSSRVWQASFMDFAVKQADPDATYDNYDDKVTWGNGAVTTDGLNSQVAGGTVLAAMGGQWSLADNEIAQNSSLEAAANGLKAKPPKKATLELGTAYDAQGNPTATQKVTLEQVIPGKQGQDGKWSPATYVVKDEHGKLQKIAETELKAKLQAIPAHNYDREKMTDHMMRQLEDDLKKKQQVVVGLRWGTFDGGNTYVDPANKKEGKDAGHFVTVTKIENGTVHFRNSHGKDDSMPIDEFKNKLGNTIAHDGIVTA